MENVKNSPFVSIVIITRNRPHIISNCLDSLLKQNYKAFEITVVDSSTDDKTKEIIKHYPDIKYIFLKDGKSKRPLSKNLGIKASKGQIIAFVDDDTLCPKGWLEECVDTYSISGVGVVGGRIIEPDTKNLDHHRNVPIGKITMTGEFIDNFDCDPWRIIDVDTLRGCNMSFRSEALKKIGFFDSNYTANNCREEADLITRAQKAGFRVVFNPKMILDHLVEKREDVDRVKTSPKSNFYIIKNTTFFFLKNFGLFNVRSIMYFLIRDTKIFHFYRTLSLSALFLIFVGIVGKIAGIWTYFNYLIFKKRDI